MDGFLKKTANQNGESSQPPDIKPVVKPREELPSSSGSTSPLAQSRRGSSPTSSNPLDRQGEEPHGTHSFEWILSGNQPMAVSCNKAGTVEDVLKRSSEFRDISEKNRNKELVIMKDGKAISSHFPCRLIENGERLTVKYFKVVKARAVKNAKQPVNGSVRRKKKRRSGEPVTFHLLTRGGKDVVNIMANSTLANSTLANISEMTVYAYKDETVKQALRGDGRLQDLVFIKNCVLCHTISGVITEMSNLVDNLDGNSFKIILRNRKNPPESLPESLELEMQNESQIIGPSGDQAPPEQSTTNGSLNENTPNQKPTLNGDMAPGSMLCEIPDSKEMKGRLQAEIQHFVKGKKGQKKTRLSRIQSLLRVDYGKNSETISEVKTMKRLMDLSNSVCQVRINGRPGGSGFLLFGKFVLTNGHVIKGIYDDSERKLTEKVAVHFSYESLDQVDPGADVEEVVGFEFGCDDSGHMNDWALLGLCADQELPGVLLKHFSFHPQRGGICIIGHPMDAVKKIDPCLIVPRDGLNQVVERHQQQNPEGVSTENRKGHIQLVTQQFFEDVKECLRQQPKPLLYESCFYYGSSGSPVFDEYCNVVAMHSGGYVYAEKEIQSVIEYGYPLSDIMERIVIQMVQRDRSDVLKEYRDSHHAHQQRVMSNLKNRSCDDESLKKKLFEFFSQVDEPVPMDTGN